MSEFREQWPTSGSDINDHFNHIQQGMGAYNGHLKLPSDHRYDIGYGALVMGGPKGSVFAEGLTRSGKSQFGMDVFGVESTVGITMGDTVPTLEGYKNPTNENEFIEGKIIIDDPNDVLLNFDEISHLKRSGDLHGWWTGTQKRMPDGRIVNLADKSTYASANFPDGIRSFELDSAMRSRLGLYILSGDVGLEVAKAINRTAEGQEPLGEGFDGGLLPKAKTRRALREYMQKIAPAPDSTIDFATEVIYRLGNSGLVNPNDIDLSNTDAVKGWMQAVRARRLVGLRRNDEGIPVLSGEITPQELVLTAPIALGSLATLSFSVAGELQDKMGYEDERNLSDIERAVFTNRAIATIAMDHLLRVTGRHDKHSDGVIKGHVANYSYANLPGNAPEDIDMVMIDKVLRKQQAQDEQGKQRKRIRNVFGRGQ